MIEIKELTGKNKVSVNSMYFFSKEEFEELPLSHRDQFLVLDKSSTDKAYNGLKERNIFCGDDGWGNNPFSKNCYREIKTIKNWKDESVLKKWLYECGIAFKSDAVILPIFSSEEDRGILTTWKMITKYPCTYFEGDNVMVCDPLLDWCLYYHHDEIMHFAIGWKHRL